MSRVRGILTLRNNADFRIIGSAELPVSTHFCRSPVAALRQRAHHVYLVAPLDTPELPSGQVALHCPYPTEALLAHCGPAIRDYYADPRRVRIM